MQGNFPEIKQEKWTGYKDICLIPDPAIPASTQTALDDLYKVCVVGTDGKNQRLKIVDQKNKVVKN